MLHVEGRIYLRGIEKSGLRRAPVSELNPLLNTLFTQDAVATLIIKVWDTTSSKEEGGQSGGMVSRQQSIP